jgi:hypothetical protein
MAAFFAERARGGVGLMVTGGIAPNRAGTVAPLAAKLTKKSEAKVSAVSNNASLAMLRALAGAARRYFCCTVRDSCSVLYHSWRAAFIASSSSTAAHLPSQALL